jgi:hypothetical protein
VALLGDNTQLGQTGSAKNIKGNLAWLPRYLQPTSNSGYFVLNAGFQDQLCVPKTPVAPTTGLYLPGNAPWPGLTEDSCVDLFQGGLH